VTDDDILIDEYFHSLPKATLRARGRFRLLEKKESAIERAKRYREKYGDAIDNITQLLSGMAEGDAELWQEIIEEPYG